MARTKGSLAWVVTTLLSLALAASLVLTWRLSDCCALGDLKPLTDAALVDKILQDSGSEKLFPLTTGIYVQSLSFETANDVQVTGRLWQRLPPGSDLPESSNLGVLFPDAISAHSGNLTPIYQGYALPDGSRLNTWNFQVLLRQDFNYSAYPLDGKRVWIRFWTDDVDNKIQLVPDLNAYADIVPTKLPGISESLVPGEWTVAKTFFAYRRLTYATDFGRNRQVFPRSPSRPELRFYIVLQRNFTDAFLVNLVPLFVTLGLLFGLMMTVSRDQEIAGRSGFSTLAVFGAASGLFFISLLGHIQIRQEFAGSQIVYIEYFYILSYVALLVVSVFSFMITAPQTPRQSWISRSDGRIVKLLYWPVILGVALAISLWQLPVDLAAIAQSPF